jgi:hypothetical protein
MAILPFLLPWPTKATTMNITPQEKVTTETRFPGTLYTQSTKQARSPTLIASGDNLTEECQDVPALRHKIDRRIVPIMFLCYLMNFIDKVALNVRSTIQ